MARTVNAMKLKRNRHGIAKERHKKGASTMRPIVIQSNRHLNGSKMCRIESRANQLDGNLGAIRLQLGNWHERNKNAARGHIVAKRATKNQFGGKNQLKNCYKSLLSRLINSNNVHVWQLNASHSNNNNNWWLPHLERAANWPRPMNVSTLPMQSISIDGNAKCQTTGLENVSYMPTVHNCCL